MTIALEKGVSIRRLGGALGAEVRGLDLAEPIPDPIMAQLRAAFAEHLVLVFPDQGHLTPAEHAAFSCRWGQVLIAPVHSAKVFGEGTVIEVPMPANKRPGILPSIAGPTENGLVGTDNWHSDMSYLEIPPAGSFLLARDIPLAGGDTMWANQYLAWENLSAPMQAILRQLEAVHALEKFRQGAAQEAQLDGLSPVRALHPAVRTIPETGREALYVNWRFTSQFKGMTGEESQPLLQFLTAYCVQPNFTYRHRWTAGDLVMWDNRCVQHFAIFDYVEARMMHRVTVKGERPTHESR